jgi:hypothetical protein
MTNNTRNIAGTILITDPQSQMIWKPNNLKKNVFRRKKTKQHNQDNQGRLMLPMREGEDQYV